MNLKNYKIEAALVFTYQCQDLSAYSGSQWIIGRDNSGNPIYGTFPTVGSWGGIGIGRNQFYVDDIVKPSPSTLKRIETITPFLPLECLPKLITSYTQTNLGEKFCFPLVPGVITFDPNDIPTPYNNYLLDEVKIRFSIVMISNDKGRDGNNIISSRILTYPVTVEESTTDLTQNVDLYLPHIPEFVKLHTQVIDPANGPIKAWDRIIIDGDISTLNGATVDLIARNEIDVISGGNVSPAFNLLIGSSFVNCASPYGEVDVNEISSFCHKSLTYDNKYYSANITNSMSFSNTFNDPKRDIVNFIIVPNPATETINLVFNTLDETQGSLFIYDITGHLIKTVFNNRPLVKGDHNIGTDIADLAAGEYIVRLITTEGVQTAKLVKIGQ